MNHEQHGKIWTLLGATSCYLILNAWLVTQQGRITLPGVNFEKHADGSAAVLSLIIGGVFFRALMSVWAIYFRSFPGANAYGRIPTIAGWDYDADSALGKRVQITFLFLFLFIPLAGLIHLNLEVYRTPTCEREATPSGGFSDASCKRIAEGANAHLTVYRHLELGRYRYRLEETSRGIQYHPFWEDWALLLWNLHLQLCGWRILWRVVSGSGPLTLWRRAESKAEEDHSGDAEKTTDCRVIAAGTWPES